MTDPALLPHTLPALGVVLVAAGRGERLGAGIPKALVDLEGRTLIEHCVSAITALPHTGHLVVVAPPGAAGETLSAISRAAPAGPDAGPAHHWDISVVAGGRERHESVRFGLDALAEGIDLVLVHDAARPLASTELFERVRAEVVRTRDAVVPVLPVVDTLKRVADDIVLATVDRSSLVIAQTPQGFLREPLAAAHEQAQSRETSSGAVADSPTDDAEVVQRAGGTVRTVPGESLAHKITTSADLELLAAHCRFASEAPR